MDPASNGYPGALSDHAIILHFDSRPDFVHKPETANAVANYPCVFLFDFPSTTRCAKHLREPQDNESISDILWTPKERSPLSKRVELRYDLGLKPQGVQIEREIYEEKYFPGAIFLFASLDKRIAHAISLCTLHLEANDRIRPKHLGLLQGTPSQVNYAHSSQKERFSQPRFLSPGRSIWPASPDYLQLQNAVESSS